MDSDKGPILFTGSESFSKDDILSMWSSCDMKRSDLVIFFKSSQFAVLNKGELYETLTKLRTLAKNGKVFAFPDNCKDDIPLPELSIEGVRTSFTGYTLVLQGKGISTCIVSMFLFQPAGMCDMVDGLTYIFRHKVNRDRCLEYIMKYQKVELIEEEIKCDACGENDTDMREKESKKSICMECLYK